MEKKLTIIILQYNGTNFTENLLESIVKFEHDNILKYDIILVDNASPEDDRFVFFKKKYPFLQLIKNDKNYGFGIGVNRIAKDVNNEYILLLNNDIILQEDSIKKVFDEIINLNADAITCEMLDGGKIVMNNFSSKPSCISFLLLNLTGLSFIWRKIVRNMNFSSRVYYINGGFLMMRTAIFKEVGYFTERFFMYTEDLDLMVKLNKLKAKMYYFPNTSIIHFDGKSSEKVWTTEDKENLLVRQALTVYKENNNIFLYKVFVQSWIFQEFLRYKITKNSKSYYRYLCLKKLRGF